MDGTFTYTVQVTDSAGASATTGNTPCTLQLPAAPAAPAAAPAVSPAAAPAAAAPDPVVKPPAETTSVTKPGVLAQPDVDPAAMAAAPRDKAVVRGPQDDHPFILGAEDQITVLVYGSPEFSGNT